MKVQRLTLCHAAKVAPHCAVMRSIHFHSQPLQRSIYLVCRGKEYKGFLTASARRLKDVQCSTCIHVKIDRRIQYGAGDRHLRRKMKNLGSTLYRVAHGSRVTNISFYNLQPAATGQRTEPCEVMLYTTPGQIVEN